MSGDGWNKTDQEDGETHNSMSSKKNNVLPLWGNERTMNLNNLILTNIQSSHYFKVNLYELKTYHEVIDEIYYKVQHLEPWEKGSRKTSGQTGMCGGVRGVGAGGIVSTAYCLLYKLFTLKLTRKQLNGLINHADSPYIRALGFMYIRYTQPPADLWDWYEEYLEDEEEVDAKAGGGQIMTIGIILRSFLTKLEWFSTLFPRIPVPIQQKIEKKMSEKFPVYSQSGGVSGSYRNKTNTSEAKHIPDSEAFYGEAERNARISKGSQDRYVSQDKYKKYDNRDYKRSYDSKDEKYKSTSRYSPERKKYKDDYSRGKDDYSRSKDDYNRSKNDYSRSKDDYSRSKDDYRSSRDKYYSHSSSRDKYDKYSSRDKDRPRKYDDERERSHRKY